MTYMILILKMAAVRVIHFSAAENSFHEENEEVGGEDSDVSGGPDRWSDVNEENISEEVVREMGDSNCEVERGFRGRAFKLGDDGKIQLEVGQLYRNMRQFRQVILIIPCKRGLCLRELKMREEELLVVVGQRAVLGECMMRTFGQMLSLVLVCLQSRERELVDLELRGGGVLGGSTSTTPSTTGPPQKIRRLEAGSTSTQPSNKRPPLTRRMNLGSTSAAIGVPINNQNMPTTTHVLWYPSTQNQSSSEAAYGSSSHTN
ncbi:hypothetical protein ACOSP7_018837 [Xanthoceras sorbifolium]